MSRFHALKVAEVRRQTPASVSIALSVPEELRREFAFQPGQYLTLRATIDGEDIRRSYSICSGPDEALVRIGVKQVEGGAFSTFANENLKPGDVVEVDAAGRALHAAARRAGPPCARHRRGVGHHADPVDREEPAGERSTARFTLIYGNQTTNSVMFAEEIEDLKNQHLQRSLGRACAEPRGAGRAAAVGPHRRASVSPRSRTAWWT